MYLFCAKVCRNKKMHRFFFQLTLLVKVGCELLYKPILVVDLKAFDSDSFTNFTLVTLVSEFPVDPSK